MDQEIYEISSPTCISHRLWNVASSSWRDRRRNSVVADFGSRGARPRTSARPMAIIIDPSIAKGQGLRQPSPPPQQPPPSYAESAATQPPVAQPGTPNVPHAHGYGPTPIGQRQQITLPYYDPRSVHSIQAAKRRAKKRFVGAALWVLLIFALLSVLIWMDVRIQLGWSVSYCALLRTGPHCPPDSTNPSGPIGWVISYTYR